ncbi:MAG: hypothetical protein ACI83N_002209, partial [Hydrogenophaga sp.]
MFQSTPLSGQIWKRLPLHPVKPIPCKEGVSNRSLFLICCFSRYFAVSAKAALLSFAHAVSDPNRTAHAQPVPPRVSRHRS